MLNPKVEEIASLDLTAEGDNRPRVPRKKEEPEPLDDALFRSRIKGRSCELIDFVLIPTYEDSVRLRASRAAEERVRNASSTDSKEGAVPGVGVKAEPIDDSRLLPEVGPADSHRNLSEEELREVAQRLKNPTVKFKKDSQFSWKVVTDRLKVVGLDRRPIDLDERTVNFMFNKHYLHNLYGGSFVDTFPTIDKDKVQVHGINDLMCLKPTFNPHAPVNPGDPGLYFSLGEGDRSRKLQRLVVRIKHKPKSLWCYMGQYRLYHTDPLTTDEFASQPVAVQKTWGKDILVKSWGRLTSARVFFRKVHGRVPSGEQVSTLANDKKRLEEARSHLTWQDVTAAFKRGEEEIVVYAMKCIDYDIEFQRILARNYRYFTPPEPKRKMPAASAHQSNTKVSAKRKRQRSVSLTPEPSEDDSGDDANGDGYGGA